MSTPLMGVFFSGSMNWQNLTVKAEAFNVPFFILISSNVRILGRVRILEGPSKHSLHWGHLSGER